MKIDHYSRILDKTKAKRIPLSLLWELTYKCNLRCCHCYAASETGRKEMSFIEIKSVLEQLVAAGCLYIVFTGGEIFTRQDFFDIAGYARKKGFALRLLTNGTLITSEIADKIKEIYPMTVEMSLYARDESIHDRVTKSRGSYKKTVDAFKLLKERGVETVMKSILMKETIGEFESLKEFAQELGSRFVYDVSIAPRNDGCKAPQHHMISDNELKQFFSPRINVQDWGPMKIADDASLCNAGMNMVSISPYGDVYPCIAIRKKCGSLRDKTFAEIWEHSSVLSEIRSMTFGDLSKCKACSLVSYCDRCTGIAFLEEGDILGPSSSACQKAEILRSLVSYK